MYKQTEWQDRVTQYEDRYRVTANMDGTYTHEEVPGEVLQAGTPQNQTNFNNAENGIQDVTMATQILAWANFHKQRHDAEHEAMVDAELLGELHEVTLTNSQRYPFNSSLDAPHTIALSQTRRNLFYSVEAEVLESDGQVGEIIISDKALNGLRIAYTGSGASVTLAVRIKGGMT